MKLRLAACLYAALMLALAGFASTALAGGSAHGNGNGGGKQQHQQSNGHHQQQSRQSSGGSGDNSTGVKPSNSTQHDTHAGASSDKTKQYGNGQTAGQIATKAGYGDATLHGPGNSQPHKTNCGSRHEIDVHALKNKTCAAVAGAEHSVHAVHHTVKHEEHHATPAPQKITICHKTGSATNPYVEITVSVNALKHGHTTAKGDIIPAPAGGCPTGQVAATTTEQTTTAQTTTEEQSCTETKVVETIVVVGVKHFVGPKGSGRYVIIHPNAHSSHYRDKHPDEILTQTVSKTETVPSTCPGTTTTEQVTTTEQAAPTTSTVAVAVVPPTTPPAPAAPATPASPASSGAVLGATAPLHTAKPKPAGGVLGATVKLGKKVGGTTLPFTGLPLWIFALVAAGLILIGALARRAGAES